ncbi:MAG: hypothetical protein AB7S41_11060 [Parvibaculaceae bacterium]|jgi:hypothetical protein
MKTIAIGFELIVRMIIFAAMLGVLASHGRESRRLVKVTARARR